MTKRRNPPRRQRPLPPFPAARRIEVGPDGHDYEVRAGRRDPVRPRLTVVPGVITKFVLGQRI